MTNEFTGMREKQAVMEDYSGDGIFRKLKGTTSGIVRVVLIAFSLFQIFSTWHVIPSTHLRPIHLCVTVSLTFLLVPVSKKYKRSYIPWYDYWLALITILVFLYPVVMFRQMVNQFGYTSLQIAIGIVGVLLLLEACRRLVGLPIVIIACIFIIIGLCGNCLPGVMRNRGFNINQIVQHLYYTQEGVFGTPVGASSTFIFLFILFGTFLDKTGVGEFFIQLSNALCGSRRGGPAKVAVVTSALMGTVSGSSVANTVGSGSFTIPMMKKLGYQPEFAAAVEASASTGGQLMPPVMGAAAFLMAENLGISYGQVIKSAAIPAVLYFSGIYIVTDLEARRLGLEGFPKEQLPKLGQVLRKRGYLMLPILVIILLLIFGYTASYAALAGIITTIVGSYFPIISLLFKLSYEKDNGKLNTGNKDSNMQGLQIQDYLDALEDGAKSIISVALACGVAGIIVGMITLTGIGMKLGGVLTSVADGNLFLLLMLTMIASIILGMGVPTTPNYLITSTIMAPIIYKVLTGFLPGIYEPIATAGEGYALLPAHLFSFYFGIIADITPPVALAAMAGAAIAKANPLKTGITASKLAITAFLVPYLFVMNPKLLMLNATWYEVLLIIMTSLIGMLGIGMGVEKYWHYPLNSLQRWLALVGGICLIYPGWITDVMGITLIGGIIIFQHINKTQV